MNIPKKYFYTGLKGYKKIAPGGKRIAGPVCTVDYVAIRTRIY